MSRKLPQDPHAERAVLAAMMLDDRSFAVVEGCGLEAGDFAYDKHRALFDMMRARHAAGELCDTFSLASALQGRPAARDVGGLGYVSEIPDNAPPATAAPVYAQRLVKLATGRELIFAAAEAQDAIHDGADPADVAMAHAQRVQAIGARRGAAREWLEPEIRVAASLAQAETIAEAAIAGTLRYVSSGLRDVDAMLMVAPGDLKITAARPGMGKSSAAVQEAWTTASQGQAAAIFSLEMPGAQLDWRIAASRAGVTIDQVRRGEVRGRDWSAFVAALDELSRLPIYVDDIPAQNVGQLYAKARRLKARRPDLALVVVDYLGLMGSPTGYEQRNRNDQLQATTGPLKAMAKELGVAVDALSQLNRKVEERKNKRPVMSDIRDSGSIEQDADAIVFLYRDDYYHPQTTEPGIAEVIVAKQRNGPQGTVKVGWQGERTRFHDLEPGYQTDPHADAMRDYLATYGPA